MIFDKTLQKMLANIHSLSISRLNELVQYNPLTGEFFWKIDRCGHKMPRAGDLAGYLSGGYLILGIDGRKYLAHLLSWMLMTGEYPETFVDHRDGDSENNKWSNLRAATRSQNNQNRAVRSSSSTGLKGVQLRRWGRYSVKINIEGRQKYLGMFDTPELASKAFNDAAIAAFGEFARVV